MPPTQMMSWKMELPWSLASSAEWATESATAVIGSLAVVLEEEEDDDDDDECFRRAMLGGQWGVGAVW